jgi:hypothetical protein
MGLFALSLALPCLTGYLLLSCLWPGPRPAGARLLLGCLAVGCGLGISSCFLFAWLVLAGPPGDGFRCAEVAAYLGGGGLLGLARWRQRLRDGPASAPQPARPPEPLNWIAPVLTALFGLAVALKLAECVLKSFESPHGIGDAWFTWNMRARFLYRGGEHWTDAFSNLIGEAVGDYPLLLPLSIARGWHYLGRDSQVVPATVALLFTFATVGTLFAGLTVLRGRSQGALAGLLLLGTFFYVYVGYAQVADVPLSFFFLAALTLLAVQDAFAPGAGPTALAAGLMTGFAAWTKNEGLLFAGAVVLGRLLTGLRRPWRGRAREAALLLLGALPVACVLAYFKLRLAPASSLVEGQGWQSTLDRLGDYPRYRLILAHLVGRILLLGGDGVHPPPQSWGGGMVLLLAVYPVLLGRAPEGARKAPAAPVLVVVLLMLLGYAFVYVVSPVSMGGLPGFLFGNLSRLLLHLWPLALFGVFLSAATPEEALTPGLTPAPSGQR